MAYNQIKEMGVFPDGKRVPKLPPVRSYIRGRRGRRHGCFQRVPAVGRVLQGKAPETPFRGPAYTIQTDDVWMPELPEGLVLIFQDLRIHTSLHPLYCEPETNCRVYSAVYIAVGAILPGGEDGAGIVGGGRGGVGKGGVYKRGMVWVWMGGWGSTFGCACQARPLYGRFQLACACKTPSPILSKSAEKLCLQVC